MPARVAPEKTRAGKRCARFLGQQRTGLAIAPAQVPERGANPAGRLIRLTTMASQRSSTSAERLERSTINLTHPQTWWSTVSVRTSFVTVTGLEPATKGL